MGSWTYVSNLLTENRYEDDFMIRAEKRRELVKSVGEQQLTQVILLDG